MPQTDDTTAVKLAQQGFKVFPLYGVHDGKCCCPNPQCTSPGKHPRANGWQQKASSDPATVQKTFQHFQNANVGIVTGSGLFVVDVDGPTGEASLRELEQKHSPLPETLTSFTGRDRGKHLFFRCSATTPIKNRTAIAPKLDVRGDGGYVVGPGSTHASGKRYEWRDEHTPIAHAPAWLLDVLTAKSATADATAGECIPEGERNRRMYDIVCALFREGQSEIDVLHRALAVNVERCIPPYSEPEVRDIVARVSKTNIPVAAQKRKIALRWFELDAQELVTDMAYIRLSDTQLGWRMRLVSYAWLNAGRLSANVDDLVLLVRPTSRAKFRREYRAALFDFLEVSEHGESYLVSRNLVEKHSKASDKWDEQRKAGLASAEKRERSKKVENEREAA